MSIAFGFRINSSNFIDNEMTAEKFIKLGMNVNATDNHNRTALHVAALHGN